MPVHELIITSASFPPASVRGIIQTLRPIAESANITRDVNANALDIGNPAFRKFESTLSCIDQVAPELTKLWPGVVCTVTCVTEIPYLTSGGTAIRPVFTSRVEGAWTYFRPILTMVVMTPWETMDNRWAASINWQLTLQEV